MGENNERLTEGPEAEPHSLDWPGYAGTTDRVRTKVGEKVRLRKRRLRLRGSIATTFAILAMGTLWLHPWAAKRPPASAVVLLPSREALPDGSVVEMKDG